MPTTEPFEVNIDRYEAWFDAHPDVYRSELAALEHLVDPPGRGVEIGVGTGRFAGPLGIEVGVDPASTPLARARQRGVAVVRGVAEALPLEDGAFETALLVTTICFVDDRRRALAEARRVLAPDGVLVVGFVDADSPLGRRYRERQADNPFYRDAVFVSTEDLLADLEAVGVGEVTAVQTLFGRLDELAGPDAVEPGHGEGSFVAIRARW